MERSFQERLRHTRVFGIVFGVNSTPPEDFSDAALSEFVAHHRVRIPELARGEVTIDADFQILGSSVHSDRPGVDEFDDAEDVSGGIISSLFASCRVFTEWRSGRAPWGDFRAVVGLVFPNPTRPPQYLRLDQTPVELLASNLDRWAADDSRGLTKRSDVRAALGGLSYERTGVFAIGSPGQDGERETGGARSRNSGPLEAVSNDYRALVGVLSHFDMEMRLSGAVAQGIVQKKAHAMKMLELIAARASREELFATTRSLGCQLAIDARLGSVPNIKARGATFLNASIGARTLREDEVLVPRDLRRRRKKRPAFVLLSYAGHGTPDGRLALDQETAIAADELHRISRETGQALLLILDMCHAHEFGEQYAALMKEHGTTGAVVCATSTARGSSDKAFEHRDAATVRRPPYPFTDHDNRYPGRGIFSAAFCWAFYVLRQIEIARGASVKISIQQFVDELVTPLCEILCRRFGAPPQRPTVF